MAGVNTNRTTAGVLLPAQVSSDIWEGARDQSVVMQRFNQVTLPGSGVSVQIVTGDGEAQFVGETERKPVAEPTVGSKTMRPYKIALVESFSSEFMRDKAALYRVLRQRMSVSIAKAFDAAVLHGTGAPTGDFDTLAAAPTTSINTAGSVYSGLLGALSSVSTAGGDVDAWVLAPQGEIKVLGEVDGNNRPLFTVNPQQDGTIGSLLGRSVYKSRTAYVAAGGVGEDETLGIAGEWGSGYWGSVEGIRYEEYNGPIFNADGSLKHAGAQDNMSSAICEIEVGSLLRDANRFVRLTGTEGA